MIPRKASYAAKLIPTYGATPIAVATIPRYNPRTPPSSRMILRVIPNTDRLAFEKSVFGLKPDAPGVEDGAESTDNANGGRFWTGILAVAIDKRERTRSKGYVEPKIKSECQSERELDHFAQTEVMPANAPLINRVGVSSSLDP